MFVEFIAGFCEINVVGEVVRVDLERAGNLLGFGQDLVEKIQSLLGTEKRFVLVVDDDPAVSESIRMQLEDKGFIVDVARDGDEAIDRLEAKVPDLVILDIIMPRRNGHEVLRWIRNEATTSDLPVIVLSGHPLIGEHEELLHLGVAAHFKKSEGLSALYEKVDSVLRTQPD